MKTDTVFSPVATSRLDFIRSSSRETSLSSFASRVISEKPEKAPSRALTFRGLPLGSPLARAGDYPYETPSTKTSAPSMDALTDSSPEPDAGARPDTCAVPMSPGFLRNSR